MAANTVSESLCNELHAAILSLADMECGVRWVLFQLAAEELKRATWQATAYRVENTNERMNQYMNAVHLRVVGACLYEHDTAVGNYIIENSMPGGFWPADLKIPDELL